MSAVKFTVSLPPNAVTTLRGHAARNGQSMSRWLERAIAEAALREDLVAYNDGCERLGLNDPEQMAALLDDREQMRRAPR